MSANLNHPALLPGRLHEADFVPTLPAPPQAAEACTDLGCDVDDDGGVWKGPARVGDVVPLWLVILLIVAAAIAIVGLP